MILFAKVEKGGKGGKSFLNIGNHSLFWEKRKKRESHSYFWESNIWQVKGNKFKKEIYLGRKENRKDEIERK